MHEALSFLANHHDRLDYARAEKEGHQPGSGAGEARCKSLIAVRLHRLAVRWEQPSVDRAIEVQALALAYRWGDAIERTLKQQRREVRLAA